MLISSDKFHWNARGEGCALSDDLDWGDKHPTTFSVQSSRTGVVVDFRLVETVHYDDDEGRCLGADMNYVSQDGWSVRVSWENDARF